jgi:VanZ family protein
VIVYMALIFVASEIPNPPAPPGPLTDKPVHAAMYAGLSALVVRAIAGGWGRPVTLHTALAAVAIASAYGVTDEIHQRFVPPREADYRDVGADAAGAAAAAFALYGLSRVAGRREGTL